MTTTLLANPSILAGYVGPCLALSSRGEWLPQHIVSASANAGATANTPSGVGLQVRFAFGGYEYRADSIRLDLAPIDGRNSPAYWHVGEMVASALGLDCIGGLSLRSTMLVLNVGDNDVRVWMLSAGSGIAYFVDCEGFGDGKLWRHVPNLPDDPSAYPAALRAIACEVLGLEE